QGSSQFDPQQSPTPSNVSGSPPPVSNGTPMTPQQVEKMITLYHVSSNDSWSQEIVNGKKSNTPLNQLKRPINPDLSKNRRTESNPCGDGRGGDDLGPGFYTGDSPDFVDYYTKDHDLNTGSSIMQFQLPEKALNQLTTENIAPDDLQGFQQSMRDG